MVYSDDPSKWLLVSKLDPGGNALWTDTLPNAPYSQIDVTKAKITLGLNRVYVMCVSYGSIAAPVLSTYDVAGNLLNSVNVSGINNVWAYSPLGIHELPGGNFMVYYAYGDASSAGIDTLYVKKISGSNILWSQQYTVPRLTVHSPSILDDNGNLYFSYAYDSLVSSIHYVTSHVRKIDSNGNILWHYPHQDIVYSQLKKLPAGDLVAAGCSNPNGSLMGNNTGDITVTRINDGNGQQVWSQLYTGPSNERDEVYALETDPLNNVYIAGSEDIHDYQPMINRSFLIQYNSAGVLQYNRKGMPTSATFGLYMNPLSQLLSTSLEGSASLVLRKMNFGTGNTMDSLIQTITYPVGMTRSSANTNSDIFFTYSEGHCGANHIQAMRFCSKPICGPDGVTNQDQVFSAPYPNPTTAYIYLPDNVIGKINCQIFNIQGQSLHAPIRDHQIDLRGLNEGVYMLKISTDQTTRVFRIIKH